MPVPIYSEASFPTGIFDISGNGQVANLTEFPGGGGLPIPTGNLAVNNLIMTDQPIQFRFDWGVFGVFAHVVNPAFEWRIQIYLEQYGVGEFNLGSAGYLAVPWSTGTASSMQVNFPGTVGSTTINIPANTIPPALYDVVAVIQLYDMPSGLPCFAAAFAEFNKINFYREH